MNEEQKKLWSEITQSGEWKLLLFGLLLGTVYLAACMSYAYWDGSMSNKLLTMTGTHVLAGRAAGMSYGYSPLADIPHWLVIAANMVIEAVMVLVFYPLFVLSYRKLFVIKALQRSFERTQEAARRHHAAVQKWGILGLFVFVWFPFWMTGPLVGCIIGFLLGLRPAVNLGVVLSGTFVAIFCWATLFKKLQPLLQSMGVYVPFVFVGAVMVVAVAFHIHIINHAHDEKK